jgi:hypothetical protein
MHILAVIEHASRRIRILGATANPTPAWGNAGRTPAAVEAVLGLCVFNREGYDSVLARVFPDPPTASALSQARDRLEGDPLQSCSS